MIELQPVSRRVCGRCVSHCDFSREGDTAGYDPLVSPETGLVFIAGSFNEPVFTHRRVHRQRTCARSAGSGTITLLKNPRGDARFGGTHVFPTNPLAGSRCQHRRLWQQFCFCSYPWDSACVARVGCSR